MVSRIEYSNEEYWHFLRNVIPGTANGVVDKSPDGSELEYVIVCRSDNAFTQVLKRMKGCEEYTLEATLRLDEGFYKTSIYSPEDKRRYDIRISHRDEY